MKFLTFLIFLLLIVVLAFGLLAFRTVWMSGDLRNLQFHEPGPCEPVLGIESSQDLAVDLSSATAYIAGLARPNRTGQAAAEGSLYRYSLTGKPLQPTQLSTGLDTPISPQGLYFLKEGKERGTGPFLFVVSRGPEEDSIEVFRIQGESLVHQDSLKGDLLRNASDVAALDTTSFYVTLDHGNETYWGQRLEEFLRLKRSSVVHYDGTDFRVVASGLGSANGIAVSHDSSTLFVAATLERSLHVYSIDQTTGDLQETRQIFLDTSPDNIELDEHGTLWIAAHPKFMTFLEYCRDPEKLSPSQVLKLSFGSDDSYEIEETYLGSGDYLSGSSSAARWKNQLLIGSRYDHRFLICED